MLELQIIFNLVTGQMEIEDITNYVGLGVTPLNGLLEITDPFGVIHYRNTGYLTNGFGTPDISHLAGAPYTYSLAYPLKDGAVIPGAYKICYKVQDIFNTIRELCVNLTYSFEAPTAAIDVVVDCSNKTITSTDMTDYGSDATINSRTHSIHPPASSGLTALSGTDSALTYSNVPSITAKMWEATYTTNVTQTFTNHSVTYELSTLEDVYVDCNTACTLYASLRTIELKYQALKCKNYTSAQAMLNDYHRAATLTHLISLAERCGSGEDIGGYIEEFNAIAAEYGADCDCGCN